MSNGQGTAHKDIPKTMATIIPPSSVSQVYFPNTARGEAAVVHTQVCGNVSFYTYTDPTTNQLFIKGTHGDATAIAVTGQTSLSCPYCGHTMTAVELNAMRRKGG